MCDAINGRANQTYVIYYFKHYQECLFLKNHTLA